MQKLSCLLYKTHPDFGEFPARIFSDRQFGQNLQYKTHPEFWLLSVDCRPTWSELLRVAWDFDSLWITGPMTAHQSVVYVRHIILAPAANLCTLSAIVFLPIKAWIWCHLRRYNDGSAILLTVKGPVWPVWLKISPCITTKIMWNETAFRYNHISLWQIVRIKLYIPSITSVATNFCHDFMIVLPVDCTIKSGPRGCGKLTHNLFLH